MSEEGRVAAAAAGPRTSPFRVGAWLAEPAWNRIRREGETAKLEPRVMRLLATLAASPARPLTRQQLLDAVWPDVLVNEEALSRAVSQLRRALGDDPKSPRYVETVHKGGYCLIAPVSHASAEAESPPSRASPTRLSRLPGSLLLVVAAAITLALLYLGLGPSAETQAPKQLTPLTSETGREIDPAVAADGSRVAYLANSDTGYDLFVRAIDGGPPVRLTRDTLAKGHPSWSPDGSHIAFVGSRGDEVAVYVVASAGGAVARLVDLPSWSFGLDWSPDGRTLAYADAAPGEPPGIVLLDIASKAARPIMRGDGSAGDMKPVFSPDGKRLAFFRNDARDRQQIAVVGVEPGSEPMVIGPPPQPLRGMDWSPDGQELVFSARSGRNFGLWRLAADGGGAPTALALEGGDLFNPSISRNGRIVVEDVQQDRDLWRAELRTAGAAPLIQSTFDDYDPAYAPGDARLAFVSERSGHPELWIGSGGHEARRLTALAGPEIGHLSWSADGSRLAFLAQQDGASEIYAITASGGEPVHLLRARRSQIPIGWSTSDDGLFMLVADGAEWRLEQLNIAQRQARAIAGPKLRLAAVASDGQSVFAVAAGENKLLQIVPGEGTVRQFRLPPSLTNLVAILPAGDALYLVQDALGTAIVHRVALKSGTIREAARLDYFGGGSLSLSPDGRSLAYTRSRETANDLAWTTL